MGRCAERISLHRYAIEPIVINMVRSSEAEQDVIDLIRLCAQGAP